MPARLTVMDDADREYLLRLENLRYARWAQAHPDCRNFPGVDLRGMPLRMLDLSGADLGRANLSGARGVDSAKGLT